jgi:hypothetical protein
MCGISRYDLAMEKERLAALKLQEELKTRKRL